VKREVAAMISHLDPRLWRDGEEWKKPALMMVNLLEKPDPIAANAGLIANRDPGELFTPGTDTLFGCLHLARQLSLFIELRHGRSWARKIFAECAAVKPTRRQQGKLSNGTLLDRHDRMMPGPNVAELARHVANENKRLPRSLQRGAGGIDAPVLERHIRKLLQERREGKRRRL
jgi:hypothetical protein